MLSDPVFTLCTNRFNIKNLYTVLTQKVYVFCVVLCKVKRENQQDATNSMFIIKLLSQHVSGTIMPIIRRIRPCPTACGVLPGCVGCGWLWCTTPHAVGHGLILLMMGIMMPETC